MTEGRRALISVLVLVIGLVLFGQTIGPPASLVLAVLVAVLTWVVTAPRSKSGG